MIQFPTLIKKFCDALLEYDPETKKLYWYHSERKPDLCNRWSDHEEIYEMYRERYVCRDDLDIWERFLSPENIERFAQGSTAEEHFYIRFENMGRGLEWHEISMEQMEDSHVLIGSRDVREIYQSAAITKAILPELDYVCFIDIETGSYVLYYPDANKTVFSQNTADDYDTVIDAFNRKHVIPEEAQTLTQNMRIGHVRQMLNDKNEYILYATFKKEEDLLYKKLCFAYADATRKKLVLIRTDISSVVNERKLREKEERKRVAYLENMPVACVSAEVLLDPDVAPYDFRITYSNQAYAKLVGVEVPELLKRNYYEIFPDMDRKRLPYYYDTAYNGTPHVLSWDVEEKNRHMLIHAFQIEKGHFGSVLVDTTEEYFLTKELQRSREEMQRILETTTDLIFEYHVETKRFNISRIGMDEVQKSLSEEGLIETLVQKGYLEPSCAPVLEQAFSRMKKGESRLSVNLKARIRKEEGWSWYRLNLFEFQTEYMHERKTFGYLQNINQDMLRQEELEKRAQTDPLTRVLNTSEGKRKIKQLLESQKDIKHGNNAMFIMDIDDFKQINDTYGHMAGDRVLKAFAEILRKTFRTEDVIYRLGGDEFVVFVEDAEGTGRNIESIVQQLNFNIQGLKKRYSFFGSSIGVYVADTVCSFEKYYAEADKALYETKKKGKDYFTIRKG